MKSHTYKVGTKLALAASVLLTSSSVGAIAWSGSAQAAVAAKPPVAPAASPVVKEYATFLKEKHDVVLQDQLTRGQFISAIADSLGYEAPAEAVSFTDVAASSPYYEDAAAAYEKGILSSTTVKASARLTSLNAVQFALRAADLEELAYTYPAAKVKASLTKLKLTWKPDVYGTKGAQELAAAVDTGLIPAEFYKDVTSGAAASASLSTYLIGKVLEIKGQYKHYLGYSSDSDIYAKLNDAYATSDIIKSPELQKIVDEALKQDLVTGYNLKDARYDAGFIDSLSLVYGHSDFQHALQLIGLLRSEKINAKVQFEPKTSAFIYLKEWGEPGVSDLYEVVQIENGNYIEYAKEYDIAFEFSTAADKARFDKVILYYAKKNEDKQPGLIYGSWWQPLYFSLTELTGYEKISNNKIEKGHYYAQSFSLKEKSAAVTEGFKKLDPSITVINYDFWVDAPFFRYLNGEST
ncbi:S-layer homology domain-containing protein [Cohnella lupini]|uniref:S-layer family protein n=1 Tax=Cohnella lupini TaxID=1294267 RepID=A0A3D9I156_9BACL|nr:S-layer homology domain-containing protein [Cohnella lupini]RED55474.1 S-layer family protein [Cohnella lupini]